MNKSNKYTAPDLCEAAHGAKKIIKKADKTLPRMTKEIKMTSRYFGGGVSNNPCAVSQLDIKIDCSVIKLTLIIMTMILGITVFCAMKRKLWNFCQRNIKKHSEE